MTTYGNKYWNDATDNDDKTVVPVDTKDIHKLTKLMDNAGLNYYAFSQDKLSRIAINTKDLDWFKRIVGRTIAGKLQYQSPVKPYSPPDKNIIGNSEYRYIPNKTYFQGDKDVVLKMASLLEEEGIKFSGRIYSNGIAKLTFSAADLEQIHRAENKVKELRTPAAQATIAFSSEDMSKVADAHNKVSEKRADFAKTKKRKYEKIGNISYESIEEKEYYIPSISVKDFKRLQPFLDKMTEYSGIIEKDKIKLTTSRGNMPELINAFRYAETELDIIDELIEKDLSAEQALILKSAVEVSAQNNITNLAEWVDNRYSDSELEQLAGLIIDYSSQSDYDRMYDKNGYFEKLNSYVIALQANLELKEILEKHSFNDEQKKALTNGFNNGISKTIIEEVNENFTVDEINTYFDMFQKAVDGKIEPESVQEYLDSIVNKQEDDSIQAEITEEKNISIKDMDFSEQLNDLYSKALDRNSDFMLMLKNNFEQSDVNLRSFADNYIDDIVTALPMPENEAFMLFYFSEEQHDNIIQNIYQMGYDETKQLIDTEKFAKEQGIPYSDNGNIDVNEELDSYYVYDGSMSPEDFEKHQLLVDLSNLIKKDDDTPYKLIEAFEKAAATNWREDTANQNSIKIALLDILNQEHLQTEKVYDLISNSSYISSVEKDFKEPIEFITAANPSEGYEIVDRSKPDPLNRPMLHFPLGKVSEDGNITLYEYDDVTISDKAQKQISEFAEKIKATYSEKISLSEHTVENAENISDIPTITCEWSESAAFENGKTYSIYEFDSIMKKADDERIAGQKAALEKYGSNEAWYGSKEDDEFTRFMGYDKTKFTVNMPDGRSITERQDIGDGFGGVIDFLKTISSYSSIIDILEQQRDLEKAKQLINDFCETEYLKGADFSDLRNIGIGHTTLTDNELPIQVTANLVDYKITYEFDNEVFSVEEYSSLNDMIENALSVLDFNELVSVPSEVVDRHINKPSNDFKITDEALGEGGAKEKFKANIEAIKTLKNIEAEKRAATPEEKEALSKYVGWGGISQAFDDKNKAWEKEYTQLKELLTGAEYRSASASTLDAFYTSPVIIDGIYKALDKFGYEGGNVLEPALGVGNFIGRMPEEMAKHTHFYGTEIDSISGRIAQQLYPKAEIKVEGFENNEYQNGSFDVAVGNVPFGDLGFIDKVHNTHKLHDYFFAETIDKVKDGGLIAFITSTGTLDKKDESIRKMIAEKADLIGAIRLPSGAFKANAGTEVTSDIIFLQKRSTPQTQTPEWVHIGETDDGLSVNKYFLDNSDMILGELVKDTNPLSSGTMVKSFENLELKELLSNAVDKLSATISEERAKDVYERNTENAMRPPEELRNYSLFEVDNNIYFKLDNKAYDFKYNQKTATYKRAKAFIELRDTTRALLAAQEQNKPDEIIKELQVKLNSQYDDFYSHYGLISSSGNRKIFREDISYNLLTTLEKEHNGKELIAKSDIFTKRTIKPAQAIEHADTALEALTLSIAEKARIDFAYMEKLTDISKDTLIKELQGEIFEIPFSNGVYQERSEYLSGDIRKKLNAAIEAAKTDSRFEGNIKALEGAMPEPLKAGDIEVKLGATWIDPKLYEQFMYETFKTPKEYRSDVESYSFWKKPKKIEVEYSNTANAYLIKNKRSDTSVTVTKSFGTDKINAYGIMESLLNLRIPKITKEIDDPNNEGKKKRVEDVEASKLAQRKAEKIKAAFKDWIFKDPERREELVKIYNERFNCIRPREYDGSNLRFPQMNSEITMQEHQKNAIAHALFGGNTLFAHSVGAGKTYEMIASAMESKRLGLCTKALMVVPNHLTEQIGADFMKLYPSANILVATKSDFTKANRQKLFSKIATGNYDAVIIGHSQLKAIPMSKERQEMILQNQIDDISQGIKLYKEQKEENSFSVKAMERTRKSLLKNLETLRAKKQDDVITFEQMGIDKLIVDEAHEFKNLFTATKLQNISGISTSASQKSLDLFMKCQYLDEKTDGKGIIMATGTPLSNSVTELHTMMRYLEYDFLKDKGLDHFDNWITIFGEQKTDWELAPAGNKFKQKTRISHYTGLPELMSMFKQIADVRTADTLNLNVPECETHIINVEATDFQKTLVQELADRADDVQAGNVDPTIDNMLRITSDGRKLGLDPRLIDPDYEDNPNTKLNQCVENVFRIYQDTSADKLTQIVFCDLGVPHNDTPVNVKGQENDDDNKSVSELESLEEECDFCVYNDIRDKLIAKGIPENEIAYIHSAKTEAQKSELFDKVKKGEIRLLIGSTSKMGTGTNVQDKLIAVHDLDIPWRPADMEQRRGRIVRQGNQNDKVHLYRYVTKGTFDAYSYQTLENKQKFISQIMTSKTPVRKCEDVDQQALSYSEIKALCTGDERIKEKMQLDNEVKELRLLKAEYNNTLYDMQDKIRSAPNKEEQLQASIDNMKKDKAHIEKLPLDSETNLPKFKITLGAETYTDRTEAAKAFEKAALDAVSAGRDQWIPIGEFQGFQLSVMLGGWSGGLHASINGAATYHYDLGVSFPNNLKRLESIYNISERINEATSRLNNLKLDVEEAKKIVAQPFAQEEELNAKSDRLEMLTDELNKAAQEVKKNNPEKKRTNYFDSAKLKKEAAKSRAKILSAPKKDKEINRGGDVLGV